MSLEPSKISKHMSEKLLAILPKVSGTHASSQTVTPPIDLSLAENLLLRDELLAFFKDAIANDLKPQDLSYPAGFGGDPALLNALASFFNTYFKPSIPVKSNHIITTSGAGNALDALLCSICEDGDSVLVPGPYWEGFGPYFKIHANVNISVVQTPTFEDSLNFGAVEALKDAYASATDPSRIKALVLTNPHNPFGQCYPPEVLRELLRFCETRGLHFVSDEVYALSSFESTSVLPPFCSALSLVGNFPETDVEQRHHGIDIIDPARVHVVWSMSKDFGSSGIRMGCVVSQANRPLLIGIGLSAYWQTSALSSVVALSLLRSENLPGLVKLNSERLSSSYRVLADTLARWGTRFIPANAGLFVFVQVIQGAQTWEDEAATVKSMADAGVIVAPGHRFDGGETAKGWVRITFAVPTETLQEALLRIEGCLVGRRLEGTMVHASSLSMTEKADKGREDSQSRGSDTSEEWLKVESSMVKDQQRVLISDR